MALLAFALVAASPYDPSCAARFVWPGFVFDSMSESRLLTVRLPLGTEFWHSDALPEVGETIDHLGMTYVVASVAQDEDRGVVVCLEEAAEPAESVLPG